MPTFIFNTPGGRKSFRVPRWAMVLAGIVAAGLGVLLLVLAASLALILVPVAFLIVGVAGWQARRQMRKQGRKNGAQSQPGARGGKRASSRPDVIEGDYKVVSHTRDAKQE
jgi:membrane protein implicated in regulation of membrane protease activity